MPSHIRFKQDYPFGEKTEREVVAPIASMTLMELGGSPEVDASPNKYQVLVGRWCYNINKTEYDRLAGKLTGKKG